MIRDIKFRGRCIKSNAWVCGDLIHGVGAKIGNIYILPNKINLAYVKYCDPLDGVKVNPDTVGQFTGLKDKNGVKIYEGDVVKINDNWNNENNPVTTYCTYEVKANLIGGLFFYCLEISEENKRVNRRGIGEDAELGNWMYRHLEVIGNIYEGQK